MADDPHTLTALQRDVEGAVRPPAFELLVRGAERRRARRRTAAGLSLVVLLAAGAGAVATSRPGERSVTLPAGPTRTATQSPTDPAPVDLSVRARAGRVIGAATRAPDVVGGADGSLFESFAGCDDLSTCESAWRTVGPDGAEVARGVLTGYDDITAYPGGFLVDDGDAAFTVDTAGRVTQLGRGVTPNPVSSSVVVSVPGKGGEPWVWRPGWSSLEPAAVGSPGPGDVAWYSLTRSSGDLWVMSSPSGGGPDTTSVHRSRDGGRSWQSATTVQGSPGSLVVSGGDVMVVTTGDCGCVTGGARSADAGVSWTAVPPGLDPASLWVTADGHLVRLLDPRGRGTTTSALSVASPGAWGSPQVRALPDRAGTPYALAVAGDVVHLPLSPDTLLRSDDLGVTWRELPAR